MSNEREHVVAGGKELVDALSRSGERPVSPPTAESRNSMVAKDPDSKSKPDASENTLEADKSSVTWVPGHFFPAEYLVRTTRRMSSQSPGQTVTHSPLLPLTTTTKSTPNRSSKKRGINSALLSSSDVLHKNASVKDAEVAPGKGSPANAKGAVTPLFPQCTTEESGAGHIGQNQGLGHPVVAESEELLQAVENSCAEDSHDFSKAAEYSVDTTADVKPAQQEIAPASSENRVSKELLQLLSDPDVILDSSSRRSSRTTGVPPQAKRPSPARAAPRQRKSTRSFFPSASVLPETCHLFSIKDFSLPPEFDEMMKNKQLESALSCGNDTLQEMEGLLWADMPTAEENSKACVVTPAPSDDKHGVLARPPDTCAINQLWLESIDPNNTTDRQTTPTGAILLAGASQSLQETTQAVDNELASFACQEHCIVSPPVHSVCSVDGDESGLATSNLDDALIEIPVVPSPPHSPVPKQMSSADQHSDRPCHPSPTPGSPVLDHCCVLSVRLSLCSHWTVGCLHVVQ